MKKILLATLLISSSAFAEGIFTFKQPAIAKGSFNSEAELYVLEKIADKWLYQGWTGFTFGDQQLTKTQHAALYQLKPDVKIGPYIGAGYDKSKPLNERADQNAGVMLQVKLWD